MAATSTDKAKDMVRAVLAADSLSLGVHWIYDAQKIVADHGRVDTLLAPGTGSYHSTKNKGEFTHYGDQIFTLLRSVAEGGYDTDLFFRDWQAMFAAYEGYMDSATRSTLKKIAQGRGPSECGSASNDMAGAGRVSPVVCSLRDAPGRLVRAVRAQTRMTHNDADTVDTAEFLARVCLACLEGTPPAEAMEGIVQDYFENTPVEMWTSQGLDAVDQDSLNAVKRFGQSCHTSEVLSGAVQIIASHEKDLGGALVASVMAGGDNAARAAVVAQVLAAYNGLDGQTAGWFNGVVRKDEINSLLDRIP
jgi:ADP-ribosylglycohydrolase